MSPNAELATEKARKQVDEANLPTTILTYVGQVLRCNLDDRADRKQRLSSILPVHNKEHILVVAGYMTLDREVTDLG